VLGLVLTLSPCYAQNQGNNSELVIKKLERELEASTATTILPVIEELLLAVIHQ